MIKKIIGGLVVLLLLSFPKVSFSQASSIFSADSSKWTQHAAYYTGSFGNIYYHYYYSSNFIKGDTIINGKFLQRLFSAGTTNKIDTVCNHFYTYLFNDSNVIYAGTNPDSMNAAYNFNLSKGDSFPIPGGINNGGPQAQTFYPKVDSVTTIFYAGKNRKYIRFSLLPYNTRIIWQEGVGDMSYGLIWNYETIMFFNSLNSSLSGFDCYFDNGTKTGIGTCQYQGCSQNDILAFNKNDNVMKVFPVPAYDRVLVDANVVGPVDVRLLDAGGRLLLSEQIKNKSWIDLNSFPDGVYNLVIKTATQSSNNKLVIIH